MRVDPEVITKNGVTNRELATCALVIVTVEAQPSHSSGVMELAPFTLVLQGRKSRDSNLFYGSCLWPRQGMAAVGEFVQGAVQAILLKGSGALVASELGIIRYVRLGGDRIDSRWSHSCFFNVGKVCSCCGICVDCCSRPGVRCLVISQGSSKLQPALYYQSLPSVVI